MQGVGLNRFYQLRNREGRTGVVVPDGERLSAWLEATLNEASSQARNGLATLTCRVAGLHCAACSWLIPEVAKKAGATAAVVNAGAGTLTIHFAVKQTKGAAFDAVAFSAQLKTLGYSLAPLAGPHHSTAQPLLLRTGLTVALALNTMLLSLSRYFGLADVDATLFIAIEALFMVLAVGVGGSYFLRKAFVAITQKSLSLDVPIALGIALGAAGSIASWLTDAPGTYFDTVTIFIALMLVGRAAQAIAAERAQREARAPQDEALWFVRRQVDRAGIEIVNARHLKVGDRIEMAPGELLLVEGRALDAREYSFEWITGEAEPLSRAAGDALPLGAKLSGQSVAIIEVTASFESERVQELLAPAVTHDVVRPQDWLKRITEAYPPAVICLALAGFGLWQSTSISSAFEVMVSLLVITCPCALGLAIPLAYELAAVRAKRHGVIVCRPSVMDRLVHLDTVVFDKTGSATLGELHLADDSALQGLTRAQRQALCALARHSNHPRCLAISAALQATVTPPGVTVSEHPGHGVEATVAGLKYRFGHSLFATCKDGAGADGDSIFSVVDGATGSATTLAAVSFCERPRPHASAEFDRLQRMGISVLVLSGDSASRVKAFAAHVGLQDEAAVGDLRPEEKAEAIERLKSEGRTVAMVGDGLNDAGALDAADVKGVPALAVPGAARSCDLAGLQNQILPLSTMVDIARRLRLVIRANVVFALAFNAVAVCLSFAGLVTPLFAAIWMPAGSLTVVLLTTAALRAGRNPTAQRAKSPNLDVAVDVEKGAAQ